MKLSVVIPSYNRLALLERALASVVDQALPIGMEPLQVVVVDDGSTDDTFAFVSSKFPSVNVIRQENLGVSAARNTGLAKTNGDWIAFLDSDDEWLADKLVKQFKLLKQSQLLVCHSEEIWIRNGRRVNQMSKHKKSGGWIFEQCLPLCAMSPSSIIIHRSVFNEVGVFDENLPACEDYDLWLRIAAHYEVAYVSDACINKYGGHADQLSKQYWGMDRFRVIALDKILSQKLRPEMRVAALTMLQSKLTILRNGAIKHNNKELKEQSEAMQEKWSLN